MNNFRKISLLTLVGVVLPFGNIWAPYLLHLPAGSPDRAFRRKLTLFETAITVIAYVASIILFAKGMVPEVDVRLLRMGGWPLAILISVIILTAILTIIFHNNRKNMPKISLISIILSLMMGVASALANGVRDENDAYSAIEGEEDGTYSLPETTDHCHKSDDPISRNLFIQYAGPSLGIGIGYDQRFKPASVFGFSVGLAFTSGSWDSSGWFGADVVGYYHNVDFKGVSIPLEANAIMGKKASKFELGIGATPCILHRRDVRHWGSIPYNRGGEVKEGTVINIFGSLNIGYRLQRKSGFFLRAGLSLLIGDIKCSPIDGWLPIPNISLGYTIR